MSCTYRLYNHIRCLQGISMNFHRQFLTQSVRTTNALSHGNNCCANTCDLWTNTTSKRFYCKTIEEQNKLQISQREKYQKEFDEFLSVPENKKRFQILELEIDVLRHNAEKVPEKIKPREWMILLKLPTKSQRIKNLNFLWRNEKLNENRKKEKAEKKAQWLAAKEAAKDMPVEETNEMKYGLQYNSLFLRIYQSTMSHGYNSKLMQAIMFEPKLVFDCSYEEHMTYREIQNCAKQLQLSFAANRLHIAPLHLNFCNLKKGGTLEEHFQTNIPNLLDDDFPATVTSQSYLDLFPKDQLVYLTPHCKTEMINYDPDLVYIIGALVDKTKPQPLSLAKAKKEGIRMLKLPINKYLNWGSGSIKSFTINQVLTILLDLRHTRDWNEALKNIPTRKLKSSRDNMLKRKVLRNMRSNEQKEEKQNETPPEMKDFSFASRRNNFRS